MKRILAGIILGLMVGGFGTKALTRGERLIASIPSSFVYDGYAINVLRKGLRRDNGDLLVQLEAKKQGHMLFDAGQCFMFHNPPSAPAIQEAIGEAVRVSASM